MKRISSVIFIGSLSFCFLPHGKKGDYDASGSFEADETIISAEASGNLKQFNLEEGQTLQQGQEVGYIDSVQLSLKKSNWKRKSVPC
ncbi:MAG: hypothetical protein IPP51_18020 [Bacteroidetes bacterium]|nr:hypothetical protein [Bacteroidota bacterium]